MNSSTDEGLTVVDSTYRPFKLHKRDPHECLPGESIAAKRKRPRKPSGNTKQQPPQQPRRRNLLCNGYDSRRFVSADHGLTPLDITSPHQLITDPSRQGSLPLGTFAYPSAGVTAGENPALSWARPDPRCGPPAPPAFYAAPTAPNGASATAALDGQGSGSPPLGTLAYPSAGGTAGENPAASWARPVDPRSVPPAPTAAALATALARVKQLEETIANKRRRPKKTGPGQVRRSWTTEDNETLLALRRDGKTWREIASELGRTKGAVSKHFKDYLEKDNPIVSAAKWTKEDDERLLALRRAGKTWREIASELGRVPSASTPPLLRTEGAVSKHYRVHLEKDNLISFSSQVRPSWTSVEDATVLFGVQNGWGWEEIGIKLGRNGDVVRSHFQNNLEEQSQQQDTDGDNNTEK